MDKDIHLAENNEYKNGDNIPIKVKDNNDGTYSLSVSVSELLNKDIGTDAGGRARVSTITTLFDGKTLNQDDLLIWENVGTGTATFIDNSTTLSVTAGQAGGLNNTILAQIGMSIQDVSDEIVLAYLATSASQSVHGALTIREY